MRRSGSESAVDSQRLAAGALIRRCLSGSEPADADQLVDLLQRCGEQVALSVARYHRVEGWLYECLLGDANVPASLLAELRSRRNWAAQRHLHGAWQLQQLSKALDEAGLRWAAVKGPVLTELLHGSGGRRTYYDLDVLVHPADFSKAIESLEAHGGRLLDRNWALLRREQRGQVHLELHGGIELDLHWNLVNVHRGRMNIDTDAVLARRMAIPLRNHRVPTLDPADTLIHLAVHAALSGGDRLVWVKDIERAVALRPPAWREVIDRSLAWRVNGPVGVMLHRARIVLDADVPPSVPVTLIGRKWFGLVERIDRRWPLEASRPGPVPGRLMARLIGHGLLGGVEVMVQRAIRHYDPREPRRSSPFTAAGDSRDREVFLSSVAAQER